MYGPYNILIVHSTIKESKWWPFAGVGAPPSLDGGSRFDS
jgi:hypothetical protein